MAGWGNSGNGFWNKPLDQVEQSVQPDLERWRSQAGAAFDPLYTAAQKYGVDPDLVLRVARAESNFNPRATSSAKAGGLMQLMPGTARDMGVTDVYDPRQNAEGGVKYLRKMLDMFGGNIEHALAAYNWGPGAVQAWRKAGADPAKRPDETQKYVNRIMGGFQGDAAASPQQVQREEDMAWFGQNQEWGGAAPSASGEQPEPEDQGLSRAAIALGLLQAGSNIFAANRPGSGLGLGALFGAGAGGFASGAGRGMAYEAQRRQQAQQEALEKFKAEQEMIKAVRERQEWQAQEEYGKTLSPEERLLYQADMANAVKQRQANPSYSAVQGTDEYGNPTFGIFDSRTGQMVNSGQMSQAPPPSDPLTGQPLMRSPLPELAQQSLDLMEMKKSGEQTPEAVSQPGAERPKGQPYGRVFDGYGTEVQPPAKARWDAPIESVLPDGTRVMGQWDTTGRYFRPVGPSREETKVAAEQKEKAGKTEEAKEVKKKYAEVALEDTGRIKRLIEDSTLPAAGLGAGTASMIPGTNAHNISSMLNTLGSYIGFERLQEMRAASPTGGALGAVSDAENKLLQSAYGSLAQSQSKDELLYNLTRFEDSLMNVVHGEGNWYRDAKTGNVSIGQPEATNAPQAGQKDLPKGYKRIRFGSK